MMDEGKSSKSSGGGITKSKMIMMAAMIPSNTMSVAKNANHKSRWLNAKTNNKNVGAIKGSPIEIEEAKSQLVERHQKQQTKLDAECEQQKNHMLFTEEQKYDNNQPSSGNFTTWAF